MSNKPQTISRLDRCMDVVKYYVDNNLFGPQGYRKAMLSQGYTPQLARESCGKKFNSKRVQSLIKEEKARGGYTVDKAMKLLDELKKECETAKDRTNRLGCIKELNRINGLYTDEASGINITQVIVSPEERKKVLSKELKLLDDIDDAPLCIAD